MTKTGKVYLAIILFLFALSIAAPLLPLPDPDRIDLDSLQLAPDARHLFGTDHKGRDLFSRSIHGARISISVAIVAALISACIGSLVGLAAGFCGGKIDAALMAVVDFILSFPSLLLAIAVSVVMNPGIHTAMIALSASSWTSFARLVRGQVLAVRGLPFVDAARAIGCSSSRVLFVHIAPQCLTVGLVMIGMKLGGFVIAEATLSFLGLGVQPPAASWGAMISANRAYILTAPWSVFFPGIMIALTAFCFNLFAEQLRTRYDVGRIST